MGRRCCRPAPRCWPATETRRDFDPDGAVRRLNASRAIIGGNGIEEKRRKKRSMRASERNLAARADCITGSWERDSRPVSFLTGGAASLSGTFPFPIRRLRAGQRRFKVRLPHYRGSEASETPHPLRRGFPATDQLSVRYRVSDSPLPLFLIRVPRRRRRRIPSGVRPATRRLLRRSAA